MSIYDLSDPHAVRAAMAEYDSEGADTFRSRTGFGRSRKYAIVENGKQYDSKPLLARAYSIQFPDRTALTPADFSGGPGSLGPLVSRLGLVLSGGAADISEVDEIVARLTGLQQGGLPGGGKAPHKPLLVLYALARIWCVPESPRLMSFAEAAAPLNRLIVGFGGDTESANRPFFHLRNDNVWDLEDESGDVFPPGDAAPAASLLQLANGGLTVDLWEALAADREPGGIAELVARKLAMHYFGSSDTLFAAEVENLTPNGIWWVNQGKTYQQERNGGYMWAPLTNKAGTELSHHVAVSKVDRGDLVFHYSKKAIRALGRVNGAPSVEERPVELPTEDWGDEGHYAPVEYFDTEITGDEISKRPTSAGPFDSMGGVKQAYLLEVERSYAWWLYRHFRGRWPSHSPWGLNVEVEEEPNTDDVLDELASELLLPAQFLRETKKLLDDKQQIIFHGPPGTGKTYVARKLALALAGDESRVMKVQFHPSYAYEDFVEGFRPYVREDEQPGFHLVDGPLKRIAAIAHANPDETCVLLIDELNRGNVAKILGELYYLLEYRDDEMQLQYSSEPFSLPSNLLIIATMNTADRSIALVDAALRRRFNFQLFHPAEPPVDAVLAKWLALHKPQLAWLADVVDEANSRIEDRQGAIGPSHFMHSALDVDRIELTWEHSILPYIEEQYFGQPEVLERFALDDLRRAVAPPSISEREADGGGEQNATPPAS